MGNTASMLYSGAMEVAAGMIVGGVVSTFTNTYEMQEEVPVTLYSLQQEVMKIRCVINDARRRRITDQQLLDWLASIIAAVHLGEYYLRTFKSRNSHPRMTTRRETSNLAISQSYRAAKRQRTFKNSIFSDEVLKELNDSLKMLKSIDTYVFKLLVDSQPEKPLKDYLYMNHNQLFNRDKERDQFMNFLFKPQTTDENNVDILPISGSRGVGKTSFVLHCSHDPKVQNHFSLRIYTNYADITYPTESCDMNIFERILKNCNITIMNSDENTLIAMLKQILSSERFLLVLDGIPRVDPMVWNILLDCLRCGKKGSKVIRTGGYFTEDGVYEKIINLGTVKPMMLDDFSEDNYMLFFMEHAFGSADPEDYPELAKIGKKIATEMKGSIWKAKIFGELLRDNLNVEFWSMFLQEGLLNSEISQQGKDLFSVIRTVACILPKHLNVKRFAIQIFTRDTLITDKLKRFRKLLVLGPDHCTPVINKRGDIYFQFLLTKHIFLNKCRVVTGKFYLN